MTKVFQIQQIKKQYEWVTAARSTSSSSSEDVLTAKPKQDLRSKPRLFLSVAVCDIKLGWSMAREQDPVILLNLIKHFVGMTVLGGRYRPVDNEVVCCRLTLDNWDGGCESNNITKFVSALIPRAIQLNTYETLFTIRDLSQSVLDLKLDFWGSIPNFVSFSHLAGCLRKLDILCDVQRYELLDSLIHLTHLTVSDHNGKLVNQMISNEVDLARLKNLVFVESIYGLTNMDDFLTLNALLPSLTTFGSIDLCQNPYVLVVSHEHQQQIPQSCNLGRIEALGVLVQVLNEPTFAALIEAMVHSFTGVKRLIIDFCEFNGPLDFGGLEKQLRHARSSTKLLEIIVIFGTEDDMFKFEKGCEAFVGMDRRPRLKCITGEDYINMLDVMG
ncbi:hypothetical protein HDU76_011097 [Blyttiomyces sp. JEL0837]|nr:hypothetical protein HDU76_011097 [Blyttiomyces sp. JEL0837]